MAKKVEWSKAAIEDRANIYKFWVQHNKSDVYSKKLEALFNIDKIQIVRVWDSRQDPDKLEL